MKKSGPSVWELIAWGAILFMAVRAGAWSFHEYGIGPGAVGGLIGGVVADPRVWLLALAIYLLRRKRLKEQTKSSPAETT